MAEKQINKITEIIENALALANYRIEEIEIEEDDSSILIWDKNTNSHFEVNVVETY